MKNVILTGSSGMIGSIILNNCLNNDVIAKVTTIVRRASGIQHAKLTEIIHDNFTDYSGITAQLKGQDVCYFCIGVYTGTVSREVFRTITVDYTKAFASALKENSPTVTFCFLSGQGADQTEKSRVMFAKDKGIAENFLQALQFKNLHIFRPGYIYPVTPRQEPNFTYRIMRTLYRPVSAIYPNIGLTSEQLANGMTKVGLDGGDKGIYENGDIKKVVDG